MSKRACDECGAVHGPSNTNKLCPKASNYDALANVRRLIVEAADAEDFEADEGAELRRLAPLAAADLERIQLWEQRARTAEERVRELERRQRTEVERKVLELSIDVADGFGRDRVASLETKFMRAVLDMQREWACKIR